MENPLRLLDIQKGAARGSILLPFAPFSREQTTNARLSLSFRSESLSSYAFIIMRNERVLTLQAHLFALV
jgi:hypothetical protein